MGPASAAHSSDAGGVVKDNQRKGKGLQAGHRVLEVDVELVVVHLAHEETDLVVGTVLGVQLDVLARGHRGAPLEVELVHIARRVPLGLAVLERDKVAPPLRVLVALGEPVLPHPRRPHEDRLALGVDAWHDDLHRAGVAVAQRVDEVDVEQLAAQHALLLSLGRRAVVVQRVLLSLAVGAHLADERVGRGSLAALRLLLVERDGVVAALRRD
mmetsp:Transcript_11546/g.23510  ORF Transcript_11546/g.23510 Transcript_11546/m.23510 type:complete len:213 (-) Transcript_11546:262-900(-)